MAKSVPCQSDPDLFFSNRKAEIELAKEACLYCPIKSECFQDALWDEERSGIWGGTTMKDRRRLRRKLNQFQEAS